MDWPTTPPAFGPVLLREFTEDDVHLAIECGADPYIPLVGTLPAFPTHDQALAWTIPALHRVELYIEPWNTGSVRTAEKAGYQREGLLKGYQEIAGTRRDMYLYAALRP